MKHLYIVAVVILFASLVVLSLPGKVFADDDDIVFIHHSCGNNFLNQGLKTQLLTKDYIDEVNDIYYGDDLQPDDGRPDSLGGTPGDKTNMNHWVMWFNDYLSGIQTFDCSNGSNRIIMFKSCYPISNISSDGREPGDPFSSSQTLANYKSVFRKYNDADGVYSRSGNDYNSLEQVFAQNPDILFIAVTAPPRHFGPSDATNDTEA